LIQLLLCEKLINLIPSQEGLHSDILKVNDVMLVCLSLSLFSAGELLIDSSAATPLSSRGERAARVTTSRRTCKVVTALDYCTLVLLAA